MDKARIWLFVPGFVVLISLPVTAFGASVEAVKGKVLVNHGDGFKQAKSGLQVKPGDRIIAASEGSAKLVYAGGCEVKIVPGTLVSVSTRPPCTAPFLTGEAAPPQRTFFNGPVLPFAATAAVGWGIFCATTYCREHHGGGRPASP